jgi:hypothetical protein
MFYEFDMPATFGTHAVTATVDSPTPESEPLLHWGRNATRLDDILLLLSLFTMRNVWLQPPEPHGGIVGEHRQYDYGWGLRKGLPRVWVEDHGRRHDVGFAPGLQAVLERMKTSEWQAAFGRGHYLFLANQAFRRQTLESTFLLCWSIWEHLFSICNSGWMNDASIRRLSGEEKAAFVLERFALASVVGDADRSLLRKVAEARNRVIHFGKLPESTTRSDDAVDMVARFVRWTEYLVAVTLGLYAETPALSVEAFDESAAAQTTPAEPESAADSTTHVDSN